MLNVGVIGLGKMGSLHMMNCLHIEGVELIAAVDQSRKALNKARSTGVTHLYSDYHDLLHRPPPNMDAVIISLPNFLHLESIALALEAGLDVFVEKPMAKTAEECLEIVNLVRKSGRKLMVGHSSRFVDAIQKMKSVLDMGYLGSLETLTLEEIINGPFAHGSIPTPVPEWWFNHEKVGGGVLLDLGYHLIDLFRFFTRGECRVLFASIDHKLNLPIEDSAVAVLQSTDSPTKGIVNVGWYQKSTFPQFNFRVILHGSSGYMSSDQLVPNNVYLHAIKEGAKNLCRRIIGKRIKPLSYTYFATAYYNELQHFVECVMHDLEPSVSPEDGLRTIETIEEAYKTATRTTS